MALWPPSNYIFDPTKALAFAVPFSAWLFAELFPENNQDSSDKRNASHELVPHDAELARTLFGKADGEFVRFLDEHDFGGSWHRSKTAPAFELEDFLGDPNSVFEDTELNLQLSAVKTTNDEFLRVISTYGGPIRYQRDIFDMIPYQEKASGLRSASTEQRIEEANSKAESLAASLTKLFACFRKRGINMVRKEQSIGVWRPINSAD